jgi:hypothetical protein
MVKLWFLSRGARNSRLAESNSRQVREDVGGLIMTAECGGVSYSACTSTTPAGALIAPAIPIATAISIAPAI